MTERSKNKAAETRAIIKKMSKSPERVGAKAKVTHNGKTIVLVGRTVRGKLRWVRVPECKDGKTRSKKGRCTSKERHTLLQKHGLASENKVGTRKTIKVDGKSTTFVVVRANKRWVKMGGGGKRGPRKPSSTNEKPTQSKKRVAPTRITPTPVSMRAGNLQEKKNNAFENMRERQFDRWTAGKLSDEELEKYTGVRRKALSVPRKVRRSAMGMPRRAMQGRQGRKR